MGMPLTVLNRLHQGHWISVEVAAQHPEHRAWVEVFPIIDSDKGWLEYREAGLEPILRRYNVTDEPVKAFTVRHREIHQRVEDYEFNWDLVGLTVDESYSVANDRELAALLERWIPDLSDLGRHYLDPTPW